MAERKRLACLVSPIISDVKAFKSPPDTPPCQVAATSISLTHSASARPISNTVTCAYFCSFVTGSHPLGSLSFCSLCTKFSLSFPHCDPSITPTALQYPVGPDSLSLQLQPRATAAIHRFRQIYYLCVWSKVHNSRASSRARILHLPDCAATSAQRISSCNHGFHQE